MLDDPVEPRQILRPSPATGGEHRIAHAGAAGDLRRAHRRVAVAAHRALGNGDSRRGRRRQRRVRVERLVGAIRAAARAVPAAHADAALPLRRGSHAAHADAPARVRGRVYHQSARRAERAHRGAPVPQLHGGVCARVRNDAIGRCVGDRRAGLRLVAVCRRAPASATSTSSPPGCCRSRRSWPCVWATGRPFRAARRSEPSSA